MLTGMNDSDVECLAFTVQGMPQRRDLHKIRPRPSNQMDERTRVLTRGQYLNGLCVWYEIQSTSSNSPSKRT
jgi:hypothetical protein